MKKISAILCITLVLVLLATSAVAEAGYFVVRGALEENLEDGITVPASTMGDLKTKVDNLFGEKSLVLIFDLDDNTIILIGENLSGKKEYTFWHLEDSLDVLGYCYAYCSLWDDVASVIDSGYSYTIVLNGENDAATVTSSEEAKLFVATLDEMLES